MPAYIPLTLILVLATGADALTHASHFAPAPALGRGARTAVMVTPELVTTLVADTEITPIAIGGVAVLALGGGAFVYKQKQDDQERLDAIEEARIAAIEKAEEDRDMMAAQVSLVVPLVLGVLFFAAVANFA